MKLKNTLYYKALCYEIKLLGLKLPDGEQQVPELDSDRPFSDICVSSLFVWSSTSEGGNYWGKLDIELHNKYNNNNGYMDKVIKNYEKNSSPQLELF